MNNKIVFVYSLSESDLEDVMQMQVDFRETEGIIKNLQKFDTAQKYKVFKDILNELEIEFDRVKNYLTERVQKLLPELRGSANNTAKKAQLKDLIKDYDASCFKAAFIKPFLGVRRREMEIIQVPDGQILSLFGRLST